MPGTVRMNSQQQMCIEGDVTIDNVQEICAQGKQLIPSMDKLIVDLSGITNADSSCLAMLIDWVRCAGALKKPVEYTNPPREIIDLGRVCGLDNILPIGKELIW